MIYRVIEAKLAVGSQARPLHAERRPLGDPDLNVRDDDTPGKPPDRPLRAVESDGGGPASSLRSALDSLESRMTLGAGADGVDTLTDWLAQVEGVVAEIRDDDVARTREEIHVLIDQLLELNAQVQNLVRLKQLLS